MEPTRSNFPSVSTLVILAINEHFPEATFGAVPLAEQRAAVEAYLAECAWNQARDTVSSCKISRPHQSKG